MNDLKDAMRTLVVRVVGDGLRLDEVAPLHSVELSQSAAQAKEAGQNWAVTAKAYHSDISVAGDMVHAEMIRQARQAKAESV